MLPPATGDIAATRRCPALHCAAMQAGMSSINDFATTYMCQSLPFGGVKHSGFDRFAGIEGLRGMTIPKARAARACASHLAAAAAGAGAGAAAAAATRCCVPALCASLACLADSQPQPAFSLGS